MGVDGVLEHARVDVADPGEVGDGAAELHVQVRGHVPRLEVQVEQGHGAARRLGGQGELDRGDGGAYAALRPGDGDDPAARSRVQLGCAAAEMTPHAHGPGGGGVDAFGEGVVAEGQADDAAGAGVHGGGEHVGAGVGGDEDDADGREAQHQVADDVERRDRADPFVDEDDLGQLVQRLGGEAGQGVQQGRGVRDGRRGFGVGELAQQCAERAGRVDVADGGEDTDGHRPVPRPRPGTPFPRPGHVGAERITASYLSSSRVYVRSPGATVASVPPATSARRTCSANDSA